MTKHKNKFLREDMQPTLIIVYGEAIDILNATFYRGLKRDQLSVKISLPIVGIIFWFIKRKIYIEILAVVGQKTLKLMARKLRLFKLSQLATL